MAIDYHDIAAVTDTLKYVYGEGIQNQFDSDALTYNQFPKSSRSVKGLGYQFGVRYERAQGTGVRPESMKLPDPLVGKFDKGLIEPRYAYGSIRLTGPMIERAKTDVAAFVDGLADSIDDIYQSLVLDMNRMAWGDGFGLLATLTSASDTVTTSGSTTWTVTCDNDAGLMYVKEGMLVDFYESTAVDQGTVASRVSSVDLVNKTCEMEPNAGTYKTNHPNTTHAAYTITTVAVATGAYMVKMATRAATHATTETTWNEIMGLNGIFDDSTLLATFEDIAVATFPKWKANMLTNSSVNRELSLDLLLQACDLSRYHAGGKPLQMRMGLGQRRKYAALLLPDVRFAPTQLKGGYETLTFSAGDGSVEIIIDPDAQPNKIFVHPVGAIQKYEMTPLGWGDLDQKMHQRSGYDEWDLFLRLFTNIGTEQRNACTLVGDLAEPNRWS